MQGTSLANGTETHPETDWNAIDWHRAEQRVRNLRHRIFRATQAGDGKRVRSLQKLQQHHASVRGEVGAFGVGKRVICLSGLTGNCHEPF